MITAHTRLLGVIGHPVEHSLSPIFQNAALSYLNLPFVYLAFDVLPPHLGGAVEAMRFFSIRGLNVTIPYKERVIPFLDCLAGEAQVMEAVNTIVNEGGKLIGYNTDGVGLYRSLERKGVGVEGERVLLLGAGGAAKAAVWALAKKGVASVLIVNRTRERGENLAHWARAKFSLKVEVIEWEKATAGESYLWSEVAAVINATSLGLKGEEIPLPWEKLSSSVWIVDVVYRPGLTPLVREAKKRGIPSFDGKEMLIHQGAESFFLFTGERPPLQVLEEALDVKDDIS